MTIHFVTHDGGKTTPRERAILRRVEKAYNAINSHMHIRRRMRVLVCDDWTWKHLKLSPRVAMHYDPGNARIPETIFIRAEIFNHPNHPEVGGAGWVHILAHEMTHAKLKGKQTKRTGHSKLFKETAAKHGVPQEYR